MAGVDPGPLNQRKVPAMGLFDSGKRALHSLVDLAMVRLELLGTELEAEKLRLLSALFQAVVALVLIGLALVLALGFVVLLFWDGYRLAAIGVLALLFAAGGALMLMRARQLLQVRREGGPFALTLGELRRDRDSLRARDAEVPGQPVP